MIWTELKHSGGVPGEPLTPEESYRLASEKRHWERVYGDAELLDCWAPPAARPRCPEYRFYQKVMDLAPRRVLSVGGGIDYLGVHLARNGAHVVSIDLAENARSKTLEYAGRAKLAGSLELITGPLEETSFVEEFDLAVSCFSLHHMNFLRTLSQIHRALAPGGALIACETICLSPFLDFIHAHFHYRPPQEPFTPMEVELDEGDLAALASLFSRLDVEFYQLIKREMFWRLWNRTRRFAWIRHLGETDLFLTQRFPWLRKLSKTANLYAIK